MAQKPIKIEGHTGIYLIDDDFTEKTVSEENAPTKRGAYKFLIRQTVSINGKKHEAKQTVEQQGLTFKKALEAVKLLRTRENAVKQVMGITDTEQEEQRLELMTVNDVWEEFKEFKTESGAELWSKSYTRTATSLYDNHIKKPIGTSKAMQVKHKDIKALLTATRTKGFSVSIERAIVGLLRPMFTEWLTSHEIDKNNPAKDQTVRKQEDREVLLNWEQKEALYRAMYSYKDEKIRQVFIWLSTGRRVNEVLTLQHKDLDGDYFTVRAENNKARKDMKYRIPDGITLPLYKGYIHSAPRNRDKHLSQPTLHKHWFSLGSGIHTHDLRHIIATTLTDSLVPADVVSKVLGHILTGMSKKYITDTPQGADLKHKAVTFFLDKVFNRIDREMLWDKYI